MAQSTRYFQLTPDILLEYRYSGYNPSQHGDAEEWIDLNDNRVVVLENKYNDKMYTFFQDTSDIWDNREGLTHNSLGNLVLSVNKSDTKFVDVKNSDGVLYYNARNAFFNVNQLNPETEFGAEFSTYSDVVFDECVLHFTGRSYFGSYDALIIQAEIQNIDRSYASLASILIKRTDMVEHNENPMLINQRMYTTHMTFRIMSADFLYNNSTAKKVRKLLSPRYGKFLENCPITFNINGVKNSYETNDFTFYNVEQINTIQVPVRDQFSQIFVDIKEATDGDYFVITPKVNVGSNSDMSFSNYIKTIGNDVTEYIVLHEISLTEYYVDNFNDVHKQRTHMEHYMVNVQFLPEDEILDQNIYYRPIAIYGAKDIKFTIEDTLKIINTSDNTTIVKKSSIDYFQPHKYGKKMNKIYLDEVPAQVNVYNKRTDTELDIDKIKLTQCNANGSGLNIDTHQYSITGFIECSNVGIEVVQLNTTS